MSLEGIEDSKSPATENALTSALNRAGLNKNSGTANQVQPGILTEPHIPPTPHVQPRRMQLTDLSGLNPSPIAWSSTGEALEKFRKDLTSVVPTDLREYVVNIIPIDASTASLPYSVVIVAVQLRDNLNLGVGFHTLLIEASADPLPDRYENNDGRSIPVTQVTGDAYDKRTIEVVAARIDREFVGIRKVSADAAVVPRNFPTKEEDPKAIANLAKNSLAAASVFLRQLDSNYVLLNLENVDKSTLNTVHVTHRSPQGLDNHNQPVRGPVTIDLVSRPKQNSTPQVGDPLVQGTRICRMTGFMDLVYNPTEAAQQIINPYTSVQQQQQNLAAFQTYSQRFVMTSLDPSDHSLPVLLLNLALGLAMRENGEHVRYYEPNRAIQGTDITDPGALAIESNLVQNPRRFGTIAATKTPNFQRQELAQLIAMTIRPGVAMSIDIPECGASTWQLLMLLAAASNNENAYKQIIFAANTLTNGKFAEFFNGNWEDANHDQIFLPQVDRIHAGYYVDAQNTVIDIRDIDYLAVLNMVNVEEGDIALVHAWSNSFTNYTQNENYHLAERLKIIKILVPHAVITGFYRRPTFTEKFTAALVSALRAVGLSMVPTTSLDSTANQHRGVYQGMDAALGVSSNTYYNRGGVTPGNPNPMAGRGLGNGRW